MSDIYIAVIRFGDDTKLISSDSVDALQTEVLYTLPELNIEGIDFTPIDWDEMREFEEFYDFTVDMFVKYVTSYDGIAHVFQYVKLDV